MGVSFCPGVKDFGFQVGVGITPKPFSTLKTLKANYQDVLVLSLLITRNDLTQTDELSSETLYALGDFIF